MRETMTLAQQEYVARQIRRRHMVTAARILLLISVLVMWEISARVGVINDFIFSSPFRMAETFTAMVADKTIFYHAGITILETLVSLDRKSVV